MNRPESGKRLLRQRHRVYRQCRGFHSSAAAWPSLSFTGSVLQREGFNAVAEHDGLEAVNRWPGAKPHPVVLDINLARRAVSRCATTSAASRASP
jgi:hypothetical protein